MSASVKKYARFFFILLLSTLFISDAFAQRRPPRRDRPGNGRRPPTTRPTQPNPRPRPPSVRPRPTRPMPVRGCPPGTIDNGRRCISYRDIRPINCGSGRYFDGYSCRNYVTYRPVCPSGYRNRNGRCISSARRPRPITTLGQCYSWSGWDWYYDFNYCPIPIPRSPIYYDPRPVNFPTEGWDYIQPTPDPYDRYPYATMYTVDGHQMSAISIQVTENNIYIDKVEIHYSDRSISLVDDINGYYPHGSNIRSYNVDQHRPVNFILIHGFSTDADLDYDLLVSVYHTH